MADNESQSTSGQTGSRASYYSETPGSSRRITPEALARANEHIDEFASSLMAQADALASKKKDKIILTDDIDEALTIIRRGARHGMRRELGLLLCSAMFGIAIPQFFTELSSLSEQPLSGSAQLVVVYFLISLFALTTAVWIVRGD